MEARSLVLISVTLGGALAVACSGGSSPSSAAPDAGGTPPARSSAGSSVNGPLDAGPNAAGGADGPGGSTVDAGGDAASDTDAGRDASPSDAGDPCAVPAGSYAVVRSNSVSSVPNSPLCRDGQDPPLVWGGGEPAPYPGCTLSSDTATCTSVYDCSNEDGFGGTIKQHSVYTVVDRTFHVALTLQVFDDATGMLAATCTQSQVWVKQ
jgi:hypothetical protein